VRNGNGVHKKEIPCEMEMACAACGACHIADWGIPRRCREEEDERRLRPAAGPRGRTAAPHLPGRAPRAASFAAAGAHPPQICEIILVLSYFAS
jgi:hypothetical protein